VTFTFIAATGLAAAFVAACASLRAIVQALDADTQPHEPDAGIPTTLAAAGVALLAAAIVAAVRPANMVTVATWSLTLAASGLFPALVAGLWWRRTSALGATCAMLAGHAVAAVYIVATHCFAVPFFEAFGALSSAGPIARDTFTELKDAWVAAEPGAAKVAAWGALVAHARTVANLWGVNGLATVLLALPVGVLFLVLGSLASRRETAP
jgi:cation/acetate symporter